ncbi:MAG: thiamine-phosphate kinase [Bacteroidales bacterium]|nr:thiamine-phosphate kinase [Bacteroidales bacterium]MDZ4205164.1 thiamine-phosphate kinase [Bacteroidales bacterium]
MPENNISRTELSALGEFGLIEHLTKHIKLYHASTVKGVGDDTAVIDVGDHYLLATTDLLIEGIHFDLTYTPLKHLGYKAIVVNLSDIAAMNGKPTQVMVGLSVSNRYSVEALSELYEGILAACKKYKVDLVGGDTTSSPSGLFLSITALGTVAKNTVCYRHTARANDLVCVSGDLGASYMGLLLFEREKAVFINDPTMQPDLAGKEYILQRQLKPEPRFDIIHALLNAGVKPTAMIDISDGLASEILHLCKESKTGCRLFEEKLPIDPITINSADEFGIQPSTAAMNGGEDYELLFTISLDDFEKIKTIPGVTIIGHITDEEDGVQLVTSGGSLVPIKAQGWNHMK